MPTSLFTSITDTSTVRSSSASSERVEVDDAVAAGTATRATRKPSALEAVARGEHALVLEGGGDDAVAGAGRTGRAGRALHREVVGLGAAGGEHDLGRARPRGAAATSSRASSSAVLAARAAAWPPDGLPKSPARNGSIAATASGRIGVVAAWSR